MASSSIGRAPAPVTYNGNSRYRAVSLDTLDAIGRISRACREHGISPSRLGREAFGDPRFYFDLMNGRSLRPRTRARLARFIAKLGGQ
jgi:hypothetical protein